VIAILVISPDPQFLAETESQLRDDDRKISCLPNFQDAEPLLGSGLYDICILDVVQWGALPLGRSHGFSRTSTSCEMVAVADSLPEDGADALDLYGVDYLVPRSLQQTMLETLVRRRHGAHAAMTAPEPWGERANSAGKRGSPSDLDVLRDVSRILGHSLDLQSLVRHFVLKVREIVGFNRIAIFLEEPKAATPAPARQQSLRLHCACSVGIPSDVQNCVDLSKRSGIGKWVTQTGQILRAERSSSYFHSAEAARVQHEFEILGCQVAIPINDRERTLGVALLGGHLTRPSFSDEELQLMFHLMEELGLSVKNNWLHNELTANHQLFSDVLGTLQSGNLVVGSDLEVLHANRAMVQFLKGDAGDGRPSTFADLPPAVAARVHEVVEQGATVEPFFFSELPGARLVRVSVIPFQNTSRRLPQSAMVVMEDFTEIEQAKEVAVEAANLKLTSLIAKRFAHEIRNSLVPLTTHLQLLDEQYEEPGFRESMKGALKQETGRISRFTEQMLFLAEPTFPATSITPVVKLVREAFSQAQAFLPVPGLLSLQADDEAVALRCHPQALRHAFQEIFLNSLQSGSHPVEVTVTINALDANGAGKVEIAIRDSGPGFTEQTARRAADPFYTTRNTGVGLGLTVVRKVVNDLGGDVEIKARDAQSKHDIILTLFSSHTHA